MQKPKLASRFDCTGCLACVDICKHDALTSFVDSDGHNYVRIMMKRVWVVCNVNMFVQ